MNLAIASVGVERPSSTRKRGPHLRLCAASYSPPCTGGLPGELKRLALAEPPMIGAEYLTAAVPEASWRELDAAFGLKLSESNATGAGVARVRGRGKQGTPLVTARCGAAGIGDVPVAEGHGRRGRDLPPSRIWVRFVPEIC